MDDACDLYLLALESARPGSFYFVENGEASLADITTAIAHTLGLSPSELQALSSQALNLRTNV